jgi:hypothetical protein
MTGYRLSATALACMFGTLKTPTDFFSDDPFARGDDQDDARFYGKPLLVNHIDAQADAIISSFYGRLLKPGSKVLDLMSSWNSHLPESLEVAQLGLNHEELAKNPRLTVCGPRPQSRYPSVLWEP